MSADHRVVALLAAALMAVASRAQVRSTGPGPAASPARAERPGGVVGPEAMASEIHAVVLRRAGSRESHRLAVEVARTEEARLGNLAGRGTLEPDSGMLLVYDREAPVALAMPAVGFALSVAFLDTRGTVINVEAMRPGDAQARYASRRPARGALLAPGGWFERRGIVAGGAVSFLGTESRIAAVAFPGGKVRVELARTSAEIERGLMRRERLDADAGMLFVFSDRRRRSFWMKNTRIPLSIAFLDDGLAVVNLADMAPLDDRTYHHSRRPVRYALEVNQGWFSRHGVGPGTKAVFLREVREAEVPAGSALAISAGHR